MFYFFSGVFIGVQGCSIHTGSETVDKFVKYHLLSFSPLLREGFDRLFPNISKVAEPWVHCKLFCIRFYITAFELFSIKECFK